MEIKNQVGAPSQGKLWGKRGFEILVLSDSKYLNVLVKSISSLIKGNNHCILEYD